MKRLLFLFAFLSVLIIAGAQDVILEKDVDEQFKGTKGPNMRHFKHLYLGAGTVLDYDEETGASINPLTSAQFIIGYRYKLKLLSFYALGFDLNFKMNRYMFDGDDENPLDLSNPLLIVENEEKHSLTNNGPGLELYQRINIGKRGNTLGKYLDIGVQGQWNMTDVEEYILVNEADPYFGKSRIINRKLTFIEPVSYGLSARIGINKFAIQGYYRLSDYFRSEFSMSELPRLTIALQFALH
ncbi:MAG: hypothetical protein KAS71_03760 [Bacteroidales bacterium]|nr:hypothetical protein [Bacteroidales bacterium]